jgi:hypothetical protein
LELAEADMAGVANGDKTAARGRAAESHYVNELTMVGLCSVAAVAVAAFAIWVALGGQF